jgi:hypothetical protein
MVMPKGVPSSSFRYTLYQHASINEESQLSSYRVPLADRSARVVHSAGDTYILKLVAQGSHERLEVGV